MLVLEQAEAERKDLAQTEMSEKPDTLTDAAKVPVFSQKSFKRRYQIDPEFRQHVDEHQ